MPEAAAVLLVRSHMTEASSASPGPERPVIEARLSCVITAQNPRIMHGEKKTALDHEKQRYQRHARKNVVILTIVIHEYMVLRT